jgi:hypothetical protein
MLRSPNFTSGYGAGERRSAGDRHERRADHHCAAPVVRVRDRGGGRDHYGLAAMMLERPRPSPPSAAARRQRRHRALARAGRIVVGVAVGAAVVDFLIRTNWLVERDAADRQQIGNAIARLLEDSARRNG